jgi:hypothetical protein
MVQCNGEHAGKRKGGYKDRVVHQRERPGKCEGGQKLIHRCVKIREIKTFENCQSLSLIVRMMKACTGSAYNNPTMRRMMMI